MTSKQSRSLQRLFPSHLGLVGADSVRRKARELGVEAARVLCQPSAKQLTEINNLIDEGKVKTHVETVLPLTEVKKAHQLSRSGRTRGKIVLQVKA